MAVEQSVEEFFPVSKAGQEKSQILGYIMEIVASADKLAAVKDKLSLGGLGFADSKKAATELNAAINEQVKTLDAYNKKVQETIAANKNSTKAASDADKAAKEKIKTDKEAAKAVSDKVKQDQADAKIQAQLTDERALLNKALKDQEKNYANLYLTQGKNNQLTIDARNEVLQTRGVLDDLNHAIGRYGDNVGNYAGKFTGYANVLRGLRGPTKLLGEALGIGAQEADQFRIVLEHSLQGIAAFFKAKEAKQATTAADTVVTEANTVATEANAVATAELGAAEQTVAVSATEAAAATEGMAVADGIAAVASEGLATTLTGGLYIAIGAIVAAVGVAVKFLYDLVTQEKRVEEAQKAVAEAGKEVSEGLKKQIADYENVNSIRRRGLEDELSSAEKSGASQEKIFAIKKKIADFDKFNTTVIVASSGVTNASLNEVMGNYEKARDRVEFFNREILKSQKIQADNAKLGPLTSGAPFQDVDKLKKQQELAIAERDQLKSQQEYEQSILEKNANARRAADEIQIEEVKFTADERRKLLLAEAQLEADLIQAKNAKIISSEKSTEQQRIAAIKSNAAAQKEVIEAQKNDALNNPATSGADRIIAIKKAAEEEKKVTIDSQAQIYAVRQDYRKRNIEASKGIFELEAQASIDANNKIADNEKLSLSTRLTGLNNAYQEQRSLIDAQYQFQKNLNANKNTTDREAELLEKDHEAKLTALAINASAKIKDITLKDIEARKAGLETLRNDEIEFYNQANAFRNVKPAQDHSSYILDLNDQLQKGKISIAEYNKFREKADHDYSVSQLENTVQNDKDLISIAKSYGKEDFALQKKLADDEVALEDLKNKKKLDLRKQLADKEKEIANASFELLQTLGDAGYENELNRLQDQSDANDQYYAKKIKDIQDSVASGTLAEVQGAAQVTILQAEQAAKAKAIQAEQRQEQIKQARFDRDAQALSVAGNAIAAHFALIKELGPAGIPLAIANDILAAIQIATLFAKPLPHFATGVMGKKDDGHMLVGEAGPERVELPGQQPMIVSQPTIMYGPRGTNVIPLGKDEINSTMYKGMMVVQAKKEKKSETDALLRVLVQETKKKRGIVNKIVLQSDAEFLRTKRSYYGQA